jgi:thioredoxin-related protein
MAAQADPIHDGKKRAKEEGKTMVVYFYSQFCSYCEEMDRTVLGDKEIAATLKKDFIYLRIDAEKNTDIARKNGVRGYPTTMLIESNGKKIDKIPGYIEKKRFKLILSYLKGKHYKTVGMREFLTTAESRQKE